MLLLLHYLIKSPSHFEHNLTKRIISLYNVVILTYQKKLEDFPMLSFVQFLSHERCPSMSCIFSYKELLFTQYFSYTSIPPTSEARLNGLIEPRKKQSLLISLHKLLDLCNSNSLTQTSCRYQLLVPGLRSCSHL